MSFGYKVLKNNRTILFGTPCISRNVAKQYIVRNQDAHETFSRSICKFTYALISCHQKLSEHQVSLSVPKMYLNINGCQLVVQREHVQTTFFGVPFMGMNADIEKISVQSPVTIMSVS